MPKRSRAYFMHRARSTDGDSDDACGSGRTDGISGAIPAPSRASRSENEAICSSTLNAPTADTVAVGAAVEFARVRAESERKALAIAPHPSEDNPREWCLDQATSGAPDMLYNMARFRELDEAAEGPSGEPLFDQPGHVPGSQFTGWGELVASASVLRAGGGHGDVNGPGNSSAEWQARQECIAGASAAQLYFAAAAFGHIGATSVCLAGGRYAAIAGNPAHLAPAEFSERIAAVFSKHELRVLAAAALMAGEGNDVIDFGSSGFSVLWDRWVAAGVVNNDGRFSPHLPPDGHGREQLGVLGLWRAPSGRPFLIERSDSAPTFAEIRPAVGGHVVGTVALPGDAEAGSGQILGTMHQTSVISDGNTLTWHCESSRGAANVWSRIISGWIGDGVYCQRGREGGCHDGQARVDGPGVVKFTVRDIPELPDGIHRVGLFQGRQFVLFLYYDGNAVYAGPSTKDAAQCVAATRAGLCGVLLPSGTLIWDDDVRWVRV